MLAEILKNIPHKPTKTVISSDSYSSHNFNQLPIPNNPPLFKPLKNYQTPPSLNSSPHSQYGVPLVYSPEYLSSSNNHPVMVDPKAYDAYHAMKTRKLSSQHNSLSASSLPGLEHLNTPYEIQKSIEYEIKT
jgi:hypothetical protein